MENFDFLVLGNASSHYIFRVNRIPDEDETIYILNDNFDELFYGGTGMNILYSLAKVSGCSSMILTSTDERYGVQALKKLQEVHTNTDLVEIIHGKASGYIIEDVYGRRLTILGGKFDDFNGCDMPDEVFRKAGLAVFSMDDKKNVDRFLEKLEKNGTPFAFCMRSDRTIFNDDVLKRAVPKAKFLFCNAFEEKLIKEVLKLEKIQDLFEYGATEAIAVTHGADGIYCYGGDCGMEGKHIAATPVKEVVDCTGAGDGFAAGFLYGYTRNKKIEECCKLGATLSAYIIEKVGCITGAPTEQELLQRYYAREDVSEPQ